MLLGEIEIRFDAGWLLFPCQHVLFVEFIAIVNFFEIELQLVVVGDGYVRAYKCALVIVESLAKCS